MFQQKQKMVFVPSKNFKASSFHFQGICFTSAAEVMLATAVTSLVIVCGLTFGGVRGHGGEEENVRGGDTLQHLKLSSHLQLIRWCWRCNETASVIEHLPACAVAKAMVSSTRVFREAFLRCPPSRSKVFEKTTCRVQHNTLPSTSKSVFESQFSEKQPDPKSLNTAST